MRNFWTWIIYATSLTVLVQVWSANFWSCNIKYSQVLSHLKRIPSGWSFEDTVLEGHSRGDNDFTLKQDRIMKIINRSSFLQHIIVETLKRLIATRLSPLCRRKFFCIGLKQKMPNLLIYILGISSWNKCISTQMLYNQNAVIITFHMSDYVPQFWSLW